MSKSFKEFFFKGPEDNKPVSAEDLFLDVTGVKLCDTLKTFLAWLVLKKHLNPSIKINDTTRPKSIFDLGPTTQIKCLVKTLPNLKTLAQEFNIKWGNKINP
jgi:hypothetical protein